MLLHLLLPQKTPELPWIGLDTLPAAIPNAFATTRGSEAWMLSRKPEAKVAEDTVSTVVPYCDAMALRSVDVILPLSISAFFEISYLRF